MKQNTNRTINYLMISTIALVLTACGGGGGSSSCIHNLSDSDGDGFIDVADPAPNDASNPGDFSTPEKILANPKVKKALDIAKAHGVDLNPKLGKNPPNLTGYYHKDVYTGHVVISETGLKNGALLYGSESNVCSDGSWYQKKYVEFTESSSEKYNNEYHNAYLRGNGKQFTHYKNATHSCEGGVDGMGSSYSLLI